MAEACVSRTHRRHRRCRPPVLKTGTITGPHALPFGFNCSRYPRLSASRTLLGRNDTVILGLAWACQQPFRGRGASPPPTEPVSYTHLRAHETVLDLVCRLLL